MATSSHDTQPQETSLPPAMDRAEELVNVASQRVEHYASLASNSKNGWRSRVRRAKTSGRRRSIFARATARRKRRRKRPHERARLTTVSIPHNQQTAETCR